MTNDSKIDEDIKGERIAKVLARAGVASRRDIERMIEEGRIAIHGKKLQTPATLVTSLEGITVDGEVINQPTETRVWRLHKKRGTLTTHKDPEGRPTVFQKLPDHMGRVISVGRLDMNTEGLLLLTNDGELARWLELPSNNVIRRYRVRVHGRVNEKALQNLKDGVTIEGTHYGEIEASLERQTGANAWINVAIREGKNREVRRVMEHLGLDVNRLIRTHYGPFSLGTLPLGASVQVMEKQLYEVLSGYFKDAPKSIASPEVKRDPSKWAKAKKPTGNKPGTKRRVRAEEDRKTPSTDRRGAGSRSATGKRDDRSGLGDRPITGRTPSDRSSRRRAAGPQGERSSPPKSGRTSERATPLRSLERPKNPGIRSPQGKPQDSRPGSGTRGRPENRSNGRPTSRPGVRPKGRS